MPIQKFFVSSALTVALAFAATAHAQLLGGGRSFGGSLGGAMNGGPLNATAGGRFGGTAAVDGRWVNDRADRAAATTRNAAGQAQHAAGAESERAKSAAANAANQAKSAGSHALANADQAASNGATGMVNGEGATHGTLQTPVADSSAHADTGANADAAAPSKPKPQEDRKASTGGGPPAARGTGPSGDAGAKRAAVARDDRR
jgi:hypothetical protein